jgi:hypothetical protein
MSYEPPKKQKLSEPKSNGLQHFVILILFTMAIIAAGSIYVLAKFL